MKKCFFKGYKNIKNYNKYEFFLLALKLFFKKKKNNKIFFAKNYAKTFCFDLGVKRSVYTFFNLSRWSLKKRISKVEICGLKKISW